MIYLFFYNIKQHKYQSFRDNISYLINPCSIVDSVACNYVFPLRYSVCVSTMP